jgi:hypothetical protein
MCKGSSKNDIESASARRPKKALITGITGQKIKIGNRFVGDRETTLPKKRDLGVDMNGRLGESDEQ